jgi:hypothetical protein
MTVTPGRRDPWRLRPTTMEVPQPLWTATNRRGPLRFECKHRDVRRLRLTAVHHGG